VIEPRVVDLNGVIADLHELLRRSIGEDIELHFEPAPNLPLVKADSGKLEQVLLNLALNARDAMPQGGSLTVATRLVVLAGAERPGLPEGEFVRVAVTDTGEGMDQETSDRIFEPFFTTKERTEGTGLGLATVYGIVKQAGGGVFVESVPGKGTTFCVYIPVTTDTQPEPRSEIMSPARNGSKPGRNRTILLVEDEEAVRSLVSRILSKHGFEVIAFSGGSEALEYCRSNIAAIDLLLTDVVMPEMSGKILSDLLLISRPDLKTIYMSGYTDEIIAERGVLEEGAQLIQKPFKSAEIVARINSLLEMEGPR
jgi:CheY-like chemotaxis protein